MLKAKRLIGKEESVQKWRREANTHKLQINELQKRLERETNRYYMFNAMHKISLNPRNILLTGLRLIKKII